MTQTKISKHLHDKTGMQKQPIQNYIILVIINLRDKNIYATI